MWNDVEEQGIDPEDVARFALRPEFMNQGQTKAYREFKYARGGKPIDGVCRPTHANCVILKNEEVVQLKPWVRLPYPSG